MNFAVQIVDIFIAASTGNRIQVTRVLTHMIVQRSFYFWEQWYLSRNFFKSVEQPRASRKNLRISLMVLLFQLLICNLSQFL